MAPDGSHTLAARLMRAACISAPASLASAPRMLVTALFAVSCAVSANDTVPAPAAQAVQVSPAAAAPATATAPAAPPRVPASSGSVAPAASAAPAVRAAGNTPQIAAKPVTRAVIANPLWKELPPAQQAALAPLAPEWDKLDATHKSKWLAIGRKFETMKPDEQSRIQERMRAWVALTPEQRRVARESYARTKKLNNDQKSAQWEQYQKLPEEQKMKLAAEAAKNKVVTLPPSQSRSKTVPPIKSAQKPILQQSIAPKSAMAPAAPTTPVALPPPAAAPVTLAPAATAPAIEK